MRNACQICGKWEYLDKHHIFEGQGLRRQSEKYGCTILCCRRCHNDIHKHPRDYIYLKRESQLATMERLGWTIDDWHKHFGKSYLED